MSDQYTPTTEGHLVAISYKRDGKTYFLSMPSDHAEWAEQMLGLDLTAHDAEVAEKTWDDAIGEAMEQGTIQIPDNPYRKK